MKPFIKYYLPEQINEFQPMIEDIDLVLARNIEKAEFEPRVHPLILFRCNFWKIHHTEHGIDYSEYPSYKGLIHRLQSREKIIAKCVTFHTRIGSEFVRYAPNIWKYYCARVGNADISELEFRVWLNKLDAVFHDILDNSIARENNWENRLDLLKTIVKDKYCEEYESFGRSAWKQMLEDDKISRETAYRFRLADTRWLLNDFFSRFPLDFPSVEDPLVQFLQYCFECFGEYLVETHVLKTCEYCGDYIFFRCNKRFCSAKLEGKDCGRASRSERDYTIHIDERRKKSRERMREDREFRRLIEKDGEKQKKNY